MERRRPATSRNGLVLARRSANGRRRFALKIDDVGIAAGDQHLTEMKIAMNARHAAAGARLGQGFGRAAISSSRALKQRLRALAILLALPVIALLDAHRTPCRCGLCAFCAHRAASSALRSGAKAGRRRSARQDGVHFTETPADRRGDGITVGEAGRLHLVCSACRARAVSARVSWSRVHDQASP